MHPARPVRTVRHTIPAIPASRSRPALLDRPASPSGLSGRHGSLRRRHLRNPLRGPSRLAGPTQLRSPTRCKAPSGLSKPNRIQDSLANVHTTARRLRTHIDVSFGQPVDRPCPVCAKDDIGANRARRFVRMAASHRSQPHFGLADGEGRSFRTATVREIALNGQRAESATGPGHGHCKTRGRILRSSASRTERSGLRDLPGHDYRSANATSESERAMRTQRNRGERETRAG